MTEGPRFQDLSSFRLPDEFRGRPSWYVQLWWLVQSLLFHTSPQALFGWRRFLLRLFGAQIGKNVLIRPSVMVTYPWKVSIGDYSWIGDDAVIYSLGDIRIGSHVEKDGFYTMCDEMGFLVWQVFPLHYCVSDSDGLIERAEEIREETIFIKVKMRREARRNGDGTGVSLEEIEDHFPPGGPGGIELV